jgi:hypothetical protein
MTEEYKNKYEKAMISQEIQTKVSESFDQEIQAQCIKIDQEV